MIARRQNSGQTIVFGTRGSALAIVQTELVMRRFRSAFPGCTATYREIKTEGDLDKDSPLTEIGGRGVFTNALETAVLTGKVDAAVHSAKDLPTALHPEAPIVAFPERADPRDVLVSRHGVRLDALPGHPVIGTSSRRRAVQIARMRPDARIVDLRGNIDTRLRKAAGEELDAIVLAAAGLQRMAWDERITQYFEVDEVVPSPAQGALAVQARRDSDVGAMLHRLDEPSVSGPVGIERAFLAAIGAGCSMPVGAFVDSMPDGFRLTAMLADDAGERVAYATEGLSVGDEHAHVAEIAARMRAEVEPQRRRTPLNGVARPDADLQGARVVVTRPRRQAGPLAAALRGRGATPVLLPTIRIEPVADAANVDSPLRDVERGEFEWLVFTSANAVDACARRIEALGMQPGCLAATSVAAIGSATAKAARAEGFRVRLVPDTSTGEGLGAALVRVATPGSRVLYPRSAVGGDSLPAILRDAGLDVVAVDVYRTLPEEEVDSGALEDVRRGEFDLLTFSSPSSVRNLLRMLGSDGAVAKRVPAVCAGPVTLEAAKAAGFAAATCADDAGAVAMVETAAGLWRTRTTTNGVGGESRRGAAEIGMGAIGRGGD